MDTESEHDPAPRRRIHSIRSLATALAALALGACSPPAEPPPGVLLLMIDTLRADRLGCHGSGRETSPAIDALAAGGVRFERAYAPAPWTLPSVASIMTGLYPGAHGTTRIGLRLADRIPTLATMLGERG